MQVKIPLMLFRIFSSPTFLKCKGNVVYARQWNARIEIKVPGKKKEKNARIQGIYYDLSPLIFLANCISSGMVVTLFAWIPHKFVSLNSPTMCTSNAICNARRDDPWKHRSVLKS